MLLEDRSAGVSAAAVSASSPADAECKMADKRRYFERDSREKEAANSSDSRHSASIKDSQNYDEPPNSRLFILCGKNVSEDELRAAFEKFGSIKELWIVKEKASGDSKGVAYIKFLKTSEAAIAMEEMNGKFIGNNAKSLKVLIANNRDQGSRREVNEEERLLRLFIMVPKSMSESDLKEHFAQFGDVEHCNIVRDRNTKESKGFAYVKFHRISHAAKAFEGCERTFKPVFADPRPQKQLSEDRYSSAHGSTTGPYDPHEYSVAESPYQPMLNHHHHEQHGHGHHSHQPVHHQAPPRLTIVAHGSLNQDQLWRLCDFFPGLDYCNVRHDSKTRQCYASVVYNSSQSASYAKDKLHGFEYPPGHRLIVKFESSDGGRSSGPGSNSLLGPPVQGGRYNSNHNGSSSQGQPYGSRGGPDLAVLAEKLVQATSIFQAAGLAGGGHSHVNMNPLHNQQPGVNIGETYDPSYCSVKLPSPQPLAPMDSTVLERLFVVCQTSPPPLYALKDVFGRFGNLIDIFMLNGKNFGYAKYANKNSADEARTTLHGQEICGMRLKVFPAEPQDQKSNSGTSINIGGDQKCKRLKMGDDLKRD